MLQDTKYGTIAGGTMAELNIMAMGTAYVPDKKYGNFGKQKPIYRRGTFVTKAFFSGTGVAIGRSLVTSTLRGDEWFLPK